VQTEAKQAAPAEAPTLASRDELWEARYHRVGFVVLFAILAAAPAAVYPVFLMKAHAKSAKQSAFMRNTG